MAGAEVLATTFLNLLRGDWLTRLPPVAEVLLLLVFGAGFGFGLVRCRPGVAAGYALAGIVGLGLIGWLLFRACHVWFPWAVVAGGQIPGALLWAVISQSKGLAQEKEGGHRYGQEHAHGRASDGSPGRARPHPAGRRSRGADLIGEAYRYRV